MQERAHSLLQTTKIPNKKLVVPDPEEGHTPKNGKNTYEKTNGM